MTHRLDVKVNGETVTQVDFDVTYVPELGLDYISLRDWKTEEDLKAAKYAWYNKAEVCSFGPQFKEACDELTDEWYRFSVVDLSQQGTQVFDMIANDTWHLGYVTVTVDGDWAQVDYFCSEDLDPDSQWDQVHVYREFFTFFRSTEEVHRLTPRRIESPFTFGKPFRISDYFGDDRVVLLYVNNLMSFSTANPYVTRFGMNKPENQDTLNAMKALMNHAL